MNYVKLSDIRETLEKTLGHPVSRQLADYYASGDTFPAPALAEPIRLWDRGEVEAWISDWRKS